MEQQETREGIMSPDPFFESIYEALPHGVIACDRAGNIVCINAAALKLFEVTSEPLWRGTSYQQFLQQYEMGDEQQRALSLESWLMSLLIDDEAASATQEAIIVLQVPSGQKVYVTIRCSPVLDAQQHAVGTVSVFRDITHRYQKALHLQRVHQAVLSLREAIAHIPEHSELAFPEGSFLLSPPVLFVAQQLVDVIGQVLDCQHVSLLAFRPPAGYLHYVVGSGFTSEQEAYRRKTRGYFLPSDFVDETVLARLSANQEVILPADRLRLPPGVRADFGAKNLLAIPLVLEKRLAGALVIAKAGFDSEYPPEEIELVRVVATETALVLECLLYVHEQAETRARAFVRQEMDRLITEFLNLASHELKTPLTVIKGNIQLAQRRLATLRRQITEQLEHVSEHIELPLASATQSARLQERIMKELIDDASIQASTLELHMKRCDLLALLRAAVARQQRSAPERMILLEVMATENVVPIIADAERITQVIDAYLANALSSSPLDQPVTVQLTVKDAVARVSVHDEGPGIPVEEQGYVWQRSRTPGGSADNVSLM